MFDWKGFTFFLIIPFHNFLVSAWSPPCFILELTPGSDIDRKRQEVDGHVIKGSETLLPCHVWPLCLLSVVLKCCCHGSATQPGSGLFLPLCATTRLRFKAKLQRREERTTSSSPWARCGLDKGPRSMLDLRDPFDLRLWHTQSLTLNSVR